MLEPSASTAHTFQVDLRGLVDLLSHHLYSSPRVYLRELLQNAVDAITARRQIDPLAPAMIRIEATGGGLTVTDSGIGLTEADVHRFLATIGRSSKRDELAGVEAARRDFLGQFGIGLLACFLVAEQIQVRTRSAVDPRAPGVQWLAHSDGSYAVTVWEPTDDVPPGTEVTLVPRAGMERWFVPAKVTELARDVGALLPYSITVAGDGPSVEITDTPALWNRNYPSAAARRQALLGYGERVLGFTALDVVDLDVPVAGVRGVAYVLPTAANPVEKGGHRIHLKGMLVSSAATGLLPDWAFFARCVIDTDTLRPTASREALYEDETLAAVRDALGDRLRDWLAELAAEDPDRLSRFLAVHELGVKALARHDDALFTVMAPWLRFESTDGLVTLRDFARHHQVVHLARTVEEFRQVAPIAAAAGLGVINGGYTYDSELVERLGLISPTTTVAPLNTDVLLAQLDSVDPDQELALAPFLATARARVDGLDCDVVLRAFAPVTIPALYLDNPAARQERVRAQAEEQADDLWSQILSGLRATTPRAQLVLNHSSPVVRRIAALETADLVGTAIEALYGQALLMTHRPLRPSDAAVINRSFGELLAWATRTGGHEAGR